MTLPDQEIESVIGYTGWGNDITYTGTTCPIPNGTFSVSFQPQESSGLHIMVRFDSATDNYSLKNHPFYLTFQYLKKDS